MLKVDLHLHTAEDPSDNIVHDAAGLIDRAAELGFDALAITLHDRQLWERRIVDYARDRGIVLLKGIERTVAGKHVLLINFPAAAEHVRTFADIAALRSRCNGLVIAPHPFFPAPSCVGRLLDRHVDLFDAVEWTYFWTRAIDFNTRAARWAERHGKPVVGNSDLHDLRQLGRTYSLVAADRDPDAICDAIRQGDVSLTTSPAPLAELGLTLGGMAWRDRRVASPSPARAAS
jgi:predicted metal-dependent phosphoesterase TrpH